MADPNWREMMLLYKSMEQLLPSEDKRFVLKNWVYVCKLGNFGNFFPGEMLKLCGGLDFLMISGAIKVFSLKKYIVYQIVNIFMINHTVSVIRIKKHHTHILITIHS